MLEILALLITAILLGSLPSGILVAKLVGVKDPRTVGSGNIGAANMTRSGGIKAGAITFVLDFSKGFVPTFVAHKYGGYPGDFPWILGAVLVYSHCYSVFLGFKGGKGVATAAGVFFALEPLNAAIGLVAWILVFSFSRITSLAAIAAVFTIVLSLAATGPTNPILGAAIAILIVVVRRHEDNLRALIEGSERSFR